MDVPATSQTSERAPVLFRAWLGIVLLFLFFGILVLVLVAIAPHGNTYEANEPKRARKKIKRCGMRDPGIELLCLGR